MWNWNSEGSVSKMANNKKIMHCLKAIDAKTSIKSPLVYSGRMYFLWQIECCVVVRLSNNGEMC